MALEQDHKAKIAASVKARFANDPDYRAKVSQNAKDAAARRRAEREELLRLRVEVEQLRAEIARLRRDR